MSLIKERIRKLKNKFLAKYYSYIIKLSYFSNLPILKNFLIQNLSTGYKSKNIIWYLDYKRSEAEIKFFQEKKFQLLLTNILFIKELILFLDKNDAFYLKKKIFFFNILNELKVKIIISPAIHYKVNIIGYSANQFNIKFIVYHRECYNFSKLHLRGFEKTLIKFRKNFKFIDKLIVHNDIYKDKFIKFGKMDKKNIFIIGPLRFNKLKIVNKKANKNNNKIVFFGFTPMYSAWFNENPALKKIKKLGPFGEINYYLDNDLNYKNLIEKNVYFYDHFIQSNLIFINNAIKFPKIKFEIKLKWEDHRWVSLINKIINLKIGKYPPNLRITADKNYWNKIKESFLICGYGSTTLLEAAYLNVPAAQFICGELANKKIYKNVSRLRGHEKGFNFIKNENDLSKLIADRKKIDNTKKIKYSKQKFFRFVANIDKENIEEKFIKNIIQSL
tara:strand:- start:120 stop:1454 length:1335 start_codon:yes stop_codon:yes gene_type:complete